VWIEEWLSQEDVRYEEQNVMAVNGIGIVAARDRGGRLRG
jgi:hypothetical protein